MTAYQSNEYNVAPSWADLHYIEGCDEIGGSLAAQSWNYNIQLDQNITGKQVLVAVWQRTFGSAENFISCTDIDFGGNDNENTTIPTPTPTPSDPTPTPTPTPDPTSTNSSDYQYVYPQGRGSYKNGDKVKIADDGKLYKCKVAGWCNSDNEMYYKPGSGLAWQESWDALVVTLDPSLDPTPEPTPEPTPTSSGPYQYVYPQGRGSYNNGDVVKSDDNKLYKCKVAGWCNSASELYYKPGSGLAWQEAWVVLP